jgi:predicted acylesterase/phospholipase RssA
MTTVPKMVLTIDGNGKRGIFSYFVLEHFMQDKDLSNIDLIFGVSSGAISGALYATGLVGRMTERDIVLMADPIKTKNRCVPLFTSMVPGLEKTLMLWRLFGNMKFSEVDVPLCVLVDGVGDVPRIFRSWDVEDGAIALYKILDATSAYPAVFPSVEIQGKHYIDGGSIYYSPTTLAYLTALDYFSDQPFRMISLGTQKKSVLRNKKTCSGIGDHLSSGLFHTLFERQNFIMEATFSRIEKNSFLRMESASIPATTDDSFQSVYDSYRFLAQTTFIHGLNQMVRLGWWLRAV